MAKVVRIKTVQEQAEQQAAAQLKAQLDGFPEGSLPAYARHARQVMLRSLHRIEHPDNREPIWPGGFVMLSRIQTKAIWKAIRALPPEKRPQQVRDAFDAVILNLRQDTGEVLLTRDELAEEVGCSARHVSELMGTLEEMGVIRRERRRVAGMRGPGQAVYWVNPHVAWNGSLDARKAEAAEAKPPLLTLMDGGRNEG